MVNPFGILWRGIVDFYNELFPMVGMNLLWMLVSLPLAVLVHVALVGTTALPQEVALVLAMVFLALAPNPAAAGLHNYANQLVKEERVEFELFKLGLFQYWRRALALTAIGFAGFLLLVFNMQFYLGVEQWIVKAFGMLFLYALVIWAAMQLYLMPLLIEQEDKSIRLLYRNAALLVLDNIIPSFIILIVLFVLVALSTVIPLFILLITGALVALVQHRATLTLLEKYRARGKAAT